MYTTYEAWDRSQPASARFGHQCGPDGVSTADRQVRKALSGLQREMSVGAAHRVEGGPARVAECSITGRTFVVAASTRLYSGGCRASRPRRFPSLTDAMRRLGRTRRVALGERSRLKSRLRIAPHPSSLLSDLAVGKVYRALPAGNREQWGGTRHPMGEAQTRVKRSVSDRHHLLESKILEWVSGSRCVRLNERSRRISKLRLQSVGIRELAAYRDSFRSIHGADKSCR